MYQTHASARKGTKSSITFVPGATLMMTCRRNTVEPSDWKKTQNRPIAIELENVKKQSDMNRTSEGERGRRGGLCSPNISENQSKYIKIRNHFMGNSWTTCTLLYVLYFELRCYHHCSSEAWEKKGICHLPLGRISLTQLLRSPVNLANTFTATLSLSCYGNIL